MDELKIESSLLKSIVSKVISNKASKKLESDCDIKVEQLSIVNDGTKTKVNAAIRLELETKDIIKILAKLGAI